MQRSTIEMHKYVWVWMAIFTALAASFPVAIMRVSATNKFAAQPMNSLTCHGQVATHRTVTQFTTCVQLKAAANPPH